MEPKTEQVATEPQKNVPMATPVAVQQPNSEVPKQSIQASPALSNLATQQIVKAPDKSVTQSKKPILTVALSAVVFIGLVVAAYYAYSKSK